jgi:DNA-binding CsgD family transcriptional regulator
MPVDYLSIVEATYAVDRPLQGWLRAISDVADPVLARGLGVYAFCYDARDVSRLDVTAPVGTAFSETMSNHFVESTRVLSATNPDAVVAMYGQGSPVCFARDLLSLEKIPSLAGRLSQLGFTDALAVRGQLPSSRGIMLVVPITKRPSLTPRVRGSLKRLAGHLASAFRLRQLTLPALDDAEAVFDERGALIHRQSSRDPRRDVRSLGTSIRQLLAERKFRRETPERALAVWDELIAGQWSVFERFDSDGRRFVVARRNPSGVRDPRALTDDERRVLACASLGVSQKAMAYELGLAASTISMLIKQGLRKTGLRHRSELAGLFT